MNGLGMFGIIAKQVTAIDVLNNTIAGATGYNLAHDNAKAAMQSVKAQWLALRAANDPNLGTLTDDDAVRYINSLQNIANRADAIIAQDGGVQVTGDTPYAVAGGSHGTGMGPDALVQNAADYSRYVNPGTTTPDAKYYDPRTPGPNKTPIHLSTADQIKQISDSIFGSISSGAKQIFEIRALSQMSKNQPVHVPDNVGSGGGLSTNEKLGIGGIAVLGIGLLVFALARK